MGICTWCEGKGDVIKVARDTGKEYNFGTCGWCDGKGTDWKPNYEGRENRECNEHRSVGPVRAWCFDCGEWCYNPDFGEGCKGCRLGGD